MLAGVDLSEISSLKNQVSALQQELDSLKKTRQLEVDKAKLEATGDIAKQVQEAYDKGFNRCMEQFDKMKQLFGGRIP